MFSYFIHSYLLKHFFAVLTNIFAGIKKQSLRDPLNTKDKQVLFLCLDLSSESLPPFEHLSRPSYKQGRKRLLDTPKRMI